MFKQNTSSDYQIEDTRQQIIDNLIMLRVDRESAERIMSAVDNMTYAEQIKGALKFLTKITDAKSKREEYYHYSSYLAEYFCTISNLGLFAVAYYYGDFATLAAASFSALSHAVPSQRLHDLDLLGVFLIFGKAIANYKVLMEKPEILIWGAGAMTINVMDTFITRRYLNQIGPALHVTWHFAAALALYKFNQGQVEVTSEEIKSICLAAQSKMIPAFLTSAYDEVTNCMGTVSTTRNCVIL